MRSEEEEEGVRPELVVVELVPGMFVLSFLPEALPNDLFTASRPEIVLCPALVSRSWVKVPLPRLLNAARSRSLPLPYFNKVKTIAVISVSYDRKQGCGRNPFGTSGDNGGYVRNGNG